MSEELNKLIDDSLIDKLKALSEKKIYIEKLMILSGIHNHKECILSYCFSDNQKLSEFKLSDIAINSLNDIVNHDDFNIPMKEVEKEMKKIKENRSYTNNNKDKKILNNLFISKVIGMCLKNISRINHHQKTLITDELKNKNISTNQRKQMYKNIYKKVLDYNRRCQLKLSQELIDMEKDKEILFLSKDKPLGSVSYKQEDILGYYLI